MSQLYPIMEEQLPTPPASPIDSKFSHTRLGDIDLGDFQHEGGRAAYSNPPTPTTEAQICLDLMGIDVTPVSPPITAVSPLSAHSPNSTPSPSTAHKRITSPSSPKAYCSSTQVPSSQSSRNGRSTIACQNLQSIIDNHPIVHHDPSRDKFVFPEEGPSFPYMFGVSFYNVLGLPESPLVTTEDVHQAYFNLLHSPSSHTFSPKYKSWLSQIHYTLTKPEFRETYDRGRKAELFIQDRRDIEHWEENRRRERERLSRIRRRVGGEWRKNGGEVGLKLDQDRSDSGLDKTILRGNRGANRISATAADTKDITSATKSRKEGNLGLNLTVRNWRFGVKTDDNQSVSHDVTTLELEQDWENERDKFQMGEEFEGLVGGEMVVGKRMGTDFELLGEDGDSWSNEGDRGDESKARGEAEGKGGDEDDELLALETLSDIEGDEEVGKVMLDAIEGWRDTSKDTGDVVDGVVNGNEGQGEEQTQRYDHMLDINYSVHSTKDKPSPFSESQPSPTTSSHADKLDSEPPSLSPYSSSSSLISHTKDTKPETEQVAHKKAHVIAKKESQPEVEINLCFQPNDQRKEIWEHDYEGPGDGGEFSIWSILFLFYAVFKILTGIGGDADGGVWGRKGIAYKEIWEIDYCSEEEDDDVEREEGKGQVSPQDVKWKAKTNTTSSSIMDSEFLVSIGLYSVGLGGLLLWLSFV
ncbi:hypothetical protein ACMFMG_000439 [Clarireedia jacksonii]